MEVKVLGIMWQKKKVRVCGSLDIITPEKVCESIADTKVFLSTRAESDKSLRLRGDGEKVEAPSSHTYPPAYTFERKRKPKEKNKAF